MSKKKDSILLSPKHGVNPSITHCEICGKTIGVAMLGKLKDDVEAPRDIALGICDDCQKVIDQDGLIAIEVKNGEYGKKNPYRTGRLVGITKEAKDRIFKNYEGNVAYIEEEIFSHVFGDVELSKEED